MSEPTQRAIKAAEVLMSFGWDITSPSIVRCKKCNTEIIHDGSYCHRCGDKVQVVPMSTLQEIERAIAAAVDGATT